jgi:uncharacterized protein
MPHDPIRDQPTYEAAKAAFEALPQVRILYENGAGGNGPGKPGEAFERNYASFPVGGTKGRQWFFGADGALTDAKPAKRARGLAAGSADSFTWDDGARPPTSFTGDTGSGPNGIWTDTPSYNWTQNPPGTAVSYVTEPLTADTTVLGAGRVDAWMRFSDPDADLQVTVTEVRPDGKEVFVQGGWVRASMRALDRRKSKKLEPVLSLRKRDIEPMPVGEFEKVTVPLYYQGHVYRAGSRIRVIISAIGGDQPIWAFAENVPPGNAKVNIDIAHTSSMPSSVTLPTVDAGVAAPTGLPPCPGLRGQPCRDYVPLTNAPAK